MPKVYLTSESQKDAALKRLINGYLKDKSGPTISELGRVWGVNRSTVYRRLNDIGSLTIKELRGLAEFIPIDEIKKTAF